MAKKMHVKTYLRNWAGLDGRTDRTPIEVVDGYKLPILEGEPGYWTTPSGKTVVYHPNAYGWPTWYHHSTKKVVVGRGLLEAYGIPTSDL